MRKLENKRLDEIARALVKADALSSREIDTITANPALFGSILEQVGRTPAWSAPLRIFTVRALAAYFASIALVAAFVLALIASRSKPVDVTHVQAPESPSNHPGKTFTEPDKVVSSNLPRTDAPPRIERITSKTEVKFNRPKQTAAQQIRYDGDFYALSYAGDPNETERGGRIVRVDLPRSTLFAMGVDVPLENESGTVKADLLIGSDGVTRAIRVVK